MDHTEEELRGMTLRELRPIAERLGLTVARKNELVRRILVEQGTREERIRWWDAMRSLRTNEEYSQWNDEDIASEATETTGKGIWEVEAEDLENLFEEVGGEGGQAMTPWRLSRSEILTELGKHPEHRGKTHVEMEDSIGEGRVPSTRELRNRLEVLGGASSSSPERTRYSVRGAIERLGRTAMFQEAAPQEVVEFVVDTLDLANRDRYDDTEHWLRSIALDFDHWERTPPSPPRISEPLELLMSEARRKYPDLTDEEVVEKVEGASGPASPGDLERELGRKRPEEVAVTSPQKDFRWWDAMRKVRSLAKWDYEDDDVVASDASGHDGRTTPTDLARYYDERRYLGVMDSARIPHELTRNETITEIAKFPRYEDVARVDEAIPRKGRIATTKELRDHLDLLGGTSSSKPEAPGGWWEAMRNLRTLRKYQKASDEEIENLAGGTVRGLEDLFEKERRTTKLCSRARTPRRPKGMEIYVELSKMPRYRGMGASEVRDLLGMGDGEASKLLDLLGGPSSSSPKE